MPRSAELPRARLYSEGTWFVYAWLPDSMIGPKQFTFAPELELEEVTRRVQKSLDELYVKCERQVVFTRYVGSLTMRQGGAS